MNSEKELNCSLTFLDNISEAVPLYTISWFELSRYYFPPTLPFPSRHLVWLGMNVQLQPSGAWYWNELNWDCELTAVIFVKQNGGQILQTAWGEESKWFRSLDGHVYLWLRWLVKELVRMLYWCAILRKLFKISQNFRGALEWRRSSEWGGGSFARTSKIGKKCILIDHRLLQWKIMF